MLCGAGETRMAGQQPIDTATATKKILSGLTSFVFNSGFVNPMKRLRLKRDYYKAIEKRRVRGAQII